MEEAKHRSRRSASGERFGRAGIASAGARGASAAAAARSIQHAVAGFCAGALEDDSAVVVLAVE